MTVMIRISRDTRKQLDELKLFERETYGDVVDRLIKRIKSSPPLSPHTTLSPDTPLSPLSPIKEPDKKKSLNLRVLLNSLGERKNG